MESQFYKKVIHERGGTFDARDDVRSVELRPLHLVQLLVAEDLDLPGERRPRVVVAVVADQGCRLAELPRAGSDQFPVGTVQRGRALQRLALAAHALLYSALAVSVIAAPVQC